MARELSRALAAGEISFQYWAVVSGPLPESGSIEGKVRSRHKRKSPPTKATLRFQRLCGDERLSLAEVVVDKVQHHAVRSLFASEGRALAGDSRYGKPKPSRQFLDKFGLDGYLLHASQVELPQDILGARRTLEASPPLAWARLAEQKEWRNVPGLAPADGDVPT